jgi:hypothetical protein
MLTATTHFVRAVGIAPSTSTIRLDGSNSLGIQCLPVPTARERLAAPLPPLPKVDRPVRHYYTPYANNVELKNGQGGTLGLIDPNDAWWTGRQYGLPVTTAINIQRQADGSYDGQLIGADLGADDALIEVLREQQKSLSRIAFWTAIMGGITAGVVGVAVVGGIAAATHKQRGG